MANVTLVNFGDDYSTFRPDGTWGMTFTRIRGPRVPLEGVARRWLTAKGDLPWAPNAGFDVYRLLNASRKTFTLNQYQALLASEARQVDFVANAAVTITFDGFTLTVSGLITLTTRGTYPLLVMAKDAGAAIAQVPGN